MFGNNTKISLYHTTIKHWKNSYIKRWRKYEQKIHKRDLSSDWKKWLGPQHIKIISKVKEK